MAWSTARLGWVAGTGFVGLVRVKESLVLVFRENSKKEEKGIQGGCSKPKEAYFWKRGCEVSASSRHYLLNLDCDDHYVRIHSWGNSSTTSNSLRDSTASTCHDRDTNWNTVFLDINMKGLDGIQGPIYVGTGWVLRRHALYGYDAPKSKKPPARPCNCSLKWCCCGCCFSIKQKKKKTVNEPKGSPLKRISKKGDSDALASEVIKESRMCG